MRKNCLGYQTFIENKIYKFLVQQQRRLAGFFFSGFPGPFRLNQVWPRCKKVGIFAGNLHSASILTSWNMSMTNQNRNSWQAGRIILWLFHASFNFEPFTWRFNTLWRKSNILRCETPPRNSHHQDHHILCQGIPRYPWAFTSCYWKMVHSKVISFLDSELGETKTHTT